MYLFLMLKKHGPEILSGGLVIYVVSLVALQLVGAVFLDGGLLADLWAISDGPPAELPEPPPSDCIEVGGIEICGSEPQRRAS